MRRKGKKKEKFNMLTEVKGKRQKERRDLDLTVLSFPKISKN